MKFWTKWSGLIKDGVIAVLVYMLILTSSCMPVIIFLAAIENIMEGVLFGAGHAVLENLDDMPWLTYFFAPIILFTGIIFILWLFEQDKKKRKK